MTNSTKYLVIRSYAAVCYPRQMGYTMSVQDLIDALQELPKDARVAIADPNLLSFGPVIENEFMLVDGYGHEIDP